LCLLYHLSLTALVALVVVGDVAAIARQPATLQRHPDLGHVRLVAHAHDEISDGGKRHGQDVETD